MFVLTKPASAGHFDNTPDAVARVVLALSSGTENTENGVRYRISGFSPLIRYSMFAPFSEVELDKGDGMWVLKLRLGKTIFFPFAFALLDFFIFRSMGPISQSGLVAIVAVPFLVLLLAVGEARIRLGSWWRSI
jgi:hypothetical protein